MPCSWVDVCIYQHGLLARECLHSLPLCALCFDTLLNIFKRPKEHTVILHCWLLQGYLRPEVSIR